MTSDEISVVGVWGDAASDSGCNSEYREVITTDEWLNSRVIFPRKVASFNGLYKETNRKVICSVRPYPNLNGDICLDCDIIKDPKYIRGETYASLDNETRKMIEDSIVKWRKAE